MKLISAILWGAILTPLLILVCKLLGWISWSWLVAVFVAISIPLSVFLGFLALAIWIVRIQFSEEWEHQ
jgi:hypothetical protein